MKGLKIGLSEKTLILIDIEFLPGRMLQQWQVDVLLSQPLLLVEPEMV